MSTGPRSTTGRRLIAPVTATTGRVMVTTGPAMGAAIVPVAAVIAAAGTAGAIAQAEAVTTAAERIGGDGAQRALPRSLRGPRLAYEHVTSCPHTARLLASPNGKARNLPWRSGRSG
jgi:hypothetical protein